MIHALASSTPIAPFNKTMRVFHLFHLLAEVDLPPFIDDFHLKIKIILNQRTFISALVRPPHFSSGGPLGMVYELLQNYFVPNYFTNGFNFIFEVCGHIAQGHVPFLLSCLFTTSQFLTSKKKSKNRPPIVTGEVTNRLVTHTLAI